MFSCALLCVHSSFVIISIGKGELVVLVFLPSWSPIIVVWLFLTTSVCVTLCVHSNFAIIPMGKRELVALICLSSWCLVIVVWLFLTMSQVCLQFVIAVVPDHTHLLS